MRSRPRIAPGFLLAAATFLAGCSLTDPFKRPPQEQPAGWANKVAAATAWPSADWWRRFGSNRLDTLMDQAEKANFDVGAAVARVRQADAQLRIAGASLLPSVTGSAGFTRQRASMSSSTTGVTLPRAPLYNTLNFGLSTSYEIDFWGKNRALRDAAEATAIGSRYDLRTTRLTVQSSVATTYFDMVGQNERLKVAKGTVTNAEEVLDAFRDRLRAGTATALDVAQQEAVVASQRATIPPLEQQIRQDVDALAILTGQVPEAMPNELVDQPENLAGIARPVIQPGLPSELLARRPDVQSAEEQLIAANANIGNARAQFFPSISLSGQGGFQSGALSTLVQHTGLVYSFGTSVLQTIFDGGRLLGQLEQDKGRYEELVQNYRKAVVSAFSDVENALIAVGKTGEEERAQAANAETSLKAYRIAQEQLRAGVVDITTVLNTQHALFAAEDLLAQAQLSHLQAVVGLYKALGGGWEGPVAKPDVGFAMW